MKKQDVLLWLSSKNLTFSEMTDNEKLFMREELNICGAATSTSKYKEPCCKSPMENGRCKKHGGATPKGINSPHWKTGEHSKYMPKHLLAKYEEAVNNPNLMSLQEEASVLVLRQAELLEILGGNGASNHTWEELSDTWEQMSIAQRLKDSAAYATHYKRMSELLSGGLEYSRTWEEMYRVLELSKTVKQSQVRSLVSMKQTVTVEQMMSLAYAIVAIVAREVTNKKEAVNVANSIRSLIS